MLERVVESFFSKVGEKLVDYAEHTVRGIKDYNSTLQTLERNIRALCAKAYDVKEEIKNAELLSRKKRKREVENWLVEVQKIESEFRILEGDVQSEGFVSRFLGGDRAKALCKRVYELVEQSRHFGELVLDVYETKGEALLTTRLVGAAFEENLERIWELLVGDNYVSSIGICGMGGVGKTTLTKHINNQLVSNNHSVVWVTVSQEFTVKTLQDKIAHALHLKLSDEDDEDQRAARLNRVLSSLANNVVLILDDIWKNINLEKVGDPLHVEGCRLILTTRSVEVCHQIGCQEVISVKTLNADEAWNLFRVTLGPRTTLSPQVEEIAKSMAEVCDGLPLGIITLAGSMRGENAIHMWRNALAQLQISVMGHDEMEDHVFKVLKYSFDRLDPLIQRQQKSNGDFTKLQCCFLYCSLYPEDEAIFRDELVRMFISEELMDKRKSRKAQVDHGHAMLDKLVNVCLLESSDGDDYVKMHDLVRAMALKITQGKHMVAAGCLLNTIPNGEEWTMDLEKMSLIENEIVKIQNGMSPNCPKLATLLLQRNPLRFVPRSFFSQMHGLSVLYLSSTGIVKLPDSLFNSVNLKALVLKDCKFLSYVPNLSKLKALEELDLSGTGIREVPKGMGKLVRLKRLNLPFAVEAPVLQIERLIHLEEFSGRLASVFKFNRFIRSPRIHRNITYSIIVGTGRQDLDLARYYTEVCLCGLKLYERECTLAEAIQHLTFQECEGLGICLLDDFPKWSNPTSLKTLKISRCDGIVCFLTDQMAKELESNPHCNPLQTVEGIVLSELSDFMGLVMTIGAANAMAMTSPPPAQVPTIFSSLTQLIIIRCNKTTKLGLRGSEFPNLKEIFVDSCGQIQEIFEVVNADEENGRGEIQEPAISLPKLRYLCLTQLPRLTSICKATMNCSSIQTIELRGCRALEKLPLFFPTHSTLEGQPQYNRPPTLSLIDIGVGEEEWWDSLEWEHPQHKHLLNPVVSVRRL